MRKRFLLIGTMLLAFIISTVPILDTQDADDIADEAYEIALAEIREAEETGATWLQLSYLGLTELPPEIGNLPNLRWLYLQGNMLSILPPEIGNLKKLEILDLDYNQFTILPTILGNLNLQFIEANDNPLTFPPQDIMDEGSSAILDYLDDIHPYPPYKVTPVMIGTLTSWLILLFVSGFSLLSYMRWRGS